MKINKDKKFTRFGGLMLVMAFIITAIISRLVYLQLMNSQEYKEKANNRSIREIPDPAPRGNITDRNGAVLATNKQNYMLIYNETTENKESFFSTMEKVFSILDQYKEKQTDDFELKINPYRFEFKASTTEAKRIAELRFKKDRGLDDVVIKKLFSGKNKKEKEELTKEDKDKINEELLKITPEETFKYLLEQYKIDTKKYSLEEQRRFMIVKDAAKMQSFSGYKSVDVASNIKKETAFIFLQKLNDLPGIDVSTQPIRVYPYKEVGSSVLGYISKISGDNEKYKEKGYDPSSDYIGIDGIEGVFEERLKGSKGGRIVKLNKTGRVIEELGRREPYPGQNIQLTIDTNIQKAAEESLDSVMKDLQNSPIRGDVNTSNATRGAAVAIDVNTGEILALASRPGFDPNLFATPGGLTPELYKQYFNPDLTEFGKQYILNKGLMSYYPGNTLDEVLEKLFPLDKSIKNNKTIRQDLYDIYPKPFYNYATMSVVPPGSTFKAMTAIAGLESGVITPGYSISDTGVFDDGKKFVKKFAVGGYGSVDLYRGLEVSSNPYFMTVGKLLRESFGDDILAKYAWKFGLGVPPNSDEKASTGIEIPERFGQVFNTYTLSNVYATQYLWQTMSTLKAGKDARGNQFPPINLYDNEKDSDKVKDLKKQIKNSIQDSIRQGTKKFDSNNYIKMLTELVNENPIYKGKNINKDQIKRIVDVIYYVTVSDANFQLGVGANMYNAAIGQGISNFTPLQLVNFVGTLANGGDRYKLHLVKEIKDADGNVVETVKPEIVEKTNVSKENLAAVKEGMARVNAGADGTAAAVFKDFPIRTAGKTGSATFSNNQDAYGRTSYGVYIGFAPVDNPKIAVAVIVFDGGHGGYTAPVAKAMYEAYFKKELNKDKPDAAKASDSGQKENTKNSDATGNDSKDIENKNTNNR
ncbi:penicillin binding transpeptidase domain protein [Clostridium sporogenes]|uniref:penicillin-binding transpeptidase domain-containing protein n=1 Tax=Clostridium TaxID=1485 RepID=UPI00090B021F|nr:MULTISPECIES: penicillin-binding transpeptidase domain-containing protein [Clostridium]APF26768.1 penicillin binding transpeptidase domain protein [Clostridium sporogenes]MDI6918812.1 penicillin-binding transpeptidase domain-containing protein [Clostridium botulinum]WMU97054.1 penicillin-binding transpeptidase domain-containing protein [Clostridium botulinum]